MNFTRFLENRFQELSVENEVYKDAFNVRVDSEIKATHDILMTYRWLVKWLLMPKIIGHFCLVKLKLKEEPQPVMLNKIKADQLAKKAAAELLKTENVTSIHSEPKTKA